MLRRTATSSFSFLNVPQLLPIRNPVFKTKKFTKYENLPKQSNSNRTLVILAQHKVFYLPPHIASNHSVHKQVIEMEFKTLPEGTHFNIFITYFKVITSGSFSVHRELTCKICDLVIKNSTRGLTRFALLIPPQSEAEAPQIRSPHSPAENQFALYD